MPDPSGGLKSGGWPVADRGVAGLGASLAAATAIVYLAGQLSARLVATAWLDVGPSDLAAATSNRTIADVGRTDQRPEGHPPP